jgi:hypothetical protein
MTVAARWGPLRLLALAATLAVGLLLGGVRAGYAHHIPYMAQEDGYAGWSFVDFNWLLGLDRTWWVEDSLAADATVALDNWRNSAGLSPMRWTRVSSRDAADVTIAWDPDTYAICAESTRSAAGLASFSGV